MEQKKKILSDSIWSISGLVVMNVCLQFAVYPFWERRAGEETLGNILYLISLMNVISVSIGVSANYARLKRSEDDKAGNMPYIAFLGVCSLIAFSAAMLISFFGGVEMSVSEALLFGCVMCATMWRYYADVEFKLSLNYRSYFLYYFSITVGYAIGIVLFYLTGLWPLTLLTGELFGLSYVLARGRIFRGGVAFVKSEFFDITRLAVVLFGAEALATLIFNADRIMLKLLLDSTAVAEYYSASLLGKTIALLTGPLTGVIVGYLFKYKGELSVRGMNLIFGGSALIVICATAACTVGSYIIIPFLYPDQYQDIKNYFLITNLSQVLYFIANVITVILLRFAKSRYQLYVNVVYAVAFVAVCVPLTLYADFGGFCFGLLLTCFARYITSVLLGYFSVMRARCIEKKTT